MQIGVAATAPLGADVLERLAEHHEIAVYEGLTHARRGHGQQRRGRAG